MAEAPTGLPERYRHDLEVIRNTALQLQNDLAACGMAFSPDPVLSGYDDLVRRLTPLVTSLLKEPARLKALLYRMDVDEGRAAAVLASATGQAGGMAGLIVERAFLKALTRKLYQR
jgi:hypothetical protein